MIADLEVDEEKLAETGHSLEEEMGRVARFGITLKEYTKLEEISKYEYAAFVWNTDSQKYELAGRPVHTESLCRSRFNEFAEKGWLVHWLDTSKVIFKKRAVSVLCTEWEEIKED